MTKAKNVQAEQFLSVLGSMARDFSGIDDTITLYIERYVGSRKIAQIFIKHMNFSTKCDRLKELLNVSLVEKEDKDIVLRWLREARKCADIRNKWLHTPYAVNDEGKPVSAFRNDDGTDYKFSEIDLNQAIKDAIYIYSINKAGLGKKDE